MRNNSCEEEETRNGGQGAVKGNQATNKIKKWKMKATDLPGMDTKWVGPVGPSFTTASNATISAALCYF